MEGFAALGFVLCISCLCGNTYLPSETDRMQTIRFEMRVYPKIGNWTCWKHDQDGTQRGKKNVRELLS